LLFLLDTAQQPAIKTYILEHKNVVESLMIQMTIRNSFFGFSTTRCKNDQFGLQLNF
jgi:hypothetical protein